MAVSCRGVYLRGRPQASVGGKRDPSLSPQGTTDAAAFIARWQHADGSDLAKHHRFVADPGQLPGVPAADPAREDTRDNAYVFARRVTFRHGEGRTSTGRIDCYKRGAHVLAAKLGTGFFAVNIGGLAAVLLPIRPI
jgi:hypothetical protein